MVSSGTAGQARAEGSRDGLLEDWQPSEGGSGPQGTGSAEGGERVFEVTDSGSCTGDKKSKQR